MSTPTCSSPRFESGHSTRGDSVRTTGAKGDVEPGNPVHSTWGFSAGWALAAAVLLFPILCPAQEAIRLSMASADAAEARRKAATTVGFYNLRLGPTTWYFSSGLGFQYNDNIQLVPADAAKQDFIVTPELNARMLWPISEKNSINLSLGGGYSFYTTHSEFGRYFIRPGTELSLDVYVGPLWINLHDRVSITQDTTQDPTVVGTANYSRLENDLGFTVIWDLNKVVLRLGYDHGSYINLESANASYPNGQADLFFATAGYVIRSEMTTGLELTGGFVSYDMSGTNYYFSEAMQWSLGTFFEARVSEYLKGRASVGYSVFMPTTGLAEGDNYSGLYLQVGLNHRLNKYVEYAVSGGRRTSFTFYGGTVDMYSAYLSMNWHILKEIGLGTSFTYDHGSYPYGNVEVFDRYGPSITISRQLMRKLSGSLNYQYYLRQSNQDWGDYTANIVSLNFSYRF